MEPTADGPVAPEGLVRRASGKALPGAKMPRADAPAELQRGLDVV